MEVIVIVVDVMFYINSIFYAVLLSNSSYITTATATTM